jgi:hypothetical protein
LDCSAHTYRRCEDDADRRRTIVSIAPAHERSVTVFVETLQAYEREVSRQE